MNWTINAVGGRAPPRKKPTPTSGSSWLGAARALPSPAQRAAQNRWTWSPAGSPDRSRPASPRSAASQDGSRAARPHGGTRPLWSPDPAGHPQPSSWPSPEAHRGTSSVLPCSSSSRGFRASTRPGAIQFVTSRGKPWSTYAARYLLGNPIYAGFIRYSKTGELYPVAEGDKWQTIVAEASWRRATARLEHNQSKVDRRGNQPRYLLSGVARCGRCGAAMVAGQNERRVPTYRCGSKSHLSRQRELVDAM